MSEKPLGVGDLPPAGAVTDTDTSPVCQEPNGCFANDASVTLHRVTQRQLANYYRTQFAGTPPITYDNGTGQFGLAIDSSLLVVDGELGVASPLGAVPNAPLLSGSSGTLGSVSIGTGLSLTGAFPNQTLNSTGSGPGGPGTVTSITFNAPLTGGTITTSGTVGLGNVPVGNLNSGTNASSSTFWRGDGTWQVPAGGGNVTAAGLTPNQLVYGSTASAINSLVPGSPGQVLHSNGSGSLPSWGPVSLGSEVSGILPPANLGTGATGSNFLRSDGTWQTVTGGGTPGGASGNAQYNNAGAFGGSTGLTLTGTTVTALNITLGSDATGDMHYRNASGNLARTGVGVAGQTMIVSAGVPAWGNPPASSPTGSVQYNLAGSLAGTNSIIITSNKVSALTFGLGGDQNGDLYYGAAGGTLTRIAPGATPGHVLSTNGVGSAPSWIPPVTGSGSGTVNSGTQYQLAYYPTSTNAVSGNTNILTSAAGGLVLGAPSDGSLGASTINAAGMIQANTSGAIVANLTLPTGTMMHLAGTGANTRQVLTTFGAVSTLILRSSSGNAVTPLSPAAADQQLGAIQFTGYRTSVGWPTAGISRATIAARAAVPWTGIDESTYLSFTTTPSATTAELERLRIEASGALTSYMSASGTLVNPALTGQSLLVQGGDGIANNVVVLGVGGNPIINMLRANYTTLPTTANLTNVTANQTIGRFQAGGFWGTGAGGTFVNGKASLDFQAAENWTDAAHTGTRLVINTSDITTGAAAQQALIGPGVSLGTATPPAGGMLTGDLNAQRVMVNGVAVGSGGGVDTTTGGITAAGTTQGTATALTSQFNIVTTVAAGTGVILPAGSAGTHCIVRNSGANSLSVYPASGAAINAQAVNTPISVLSNSTAYFEAQSATQWFTVP